MLRQQFHTPKGLQELGHAELKKMCHKRARRVQHSRHQRFAQQPCRCEGQYRSYQGDDDEHGGGDCTHDVGPHTRAVHETLEPA